MGTTEQDLLSRIQARRTLTERIADRRRALTIDTEPDVAAPPARDEGAREEPSVLSRIGRGVRGAGRFAIRALPGGEPLTRGDEEPIEQPVEDAPEDDRTLLERGLELLRASPERADELEAAGFSPAIIAERAERGVEDVAPDIARQTGRGLSEVGHRAAVGTAELVGADRTAANLRASRELAREVYGEPETGAGMAANIGTQFAGEGALFMAPGAGAARLARGAGRGGRFLSLIADPQGFRQRAVQTFLTGAPIDIAISQAGPEESLAGALGALTGDEELTDIARDPVARGAFEVTTGFGAGEVLGEGLRLAGRARGRVARETPQEAPGAPREARAGERAPEVEDVLEAPEEAPPRPELEAEVAPRRPELEEGVDRARELDEVSIGTETTVPEEFQARVEPGTRARINRTSDDPDFDQLVEGDEVEVLARDDIEGTAEIRVRTPTREGGEFEEVFEVPQEVLDPIDGGRPPDPTERVARRRELAEEPAEARVPWRERDIEPPSRGQSQETLFPGDDTKVRTEYAVMEAGQVRASHTPEFTQRTTEEFPPEIQGRAYHGSRGRQAREHTEQIVSRFDPDRAFDRTVSAAEGPPVVTRQGINVAGNGRTIAQQRLYQTDPGRGEQLLKDELVARAEEFGLDPDVVRGMDQPILVRQVVDEGVDQLDVDQLRQLNRASDVPTGKAKDVLSDAASRADQLQGAERALRHFAETIDEDATIRSYLGTADGTTFLRRLVDDGVISPSERARFIDANTGAATDEGKQLVERMMYAAAIGDPDVIARAPASTLRKLDTALPALIRSNRIPEWELGATLRDSLDLLARARAEGLKLDDLVAQADFTRPDVDPRIAQMARFLDEAPKNTRGDRIGVKDAFRAYADEAEAFARQTESDDLFGFEPGGPEQARGRFAALVPPEDPVRRAFRRFFGQPEAPKARRVAGEAGGAARAERRSVPPRSQEDVSRFQDSATARPSRETTRTRTPPSTEGGERVFVSAMSTTSGRNITQATSDLNEVLARAEAVLPEFRRALLEVTVEVPGAQFNGARVKKRPRILEKIAEGREIETMSDYLGGRIVLDTIEDADQVVAALREKGWQVPPWGNEADEAFFDAPKGGYRARHIQLVDPERRMSVELQLAPREIADVQDEAHGFYDIFRGSVEASAEEVEAARRSSQDLFDRAWERYQARRGARPHRLSAPARASRTVAQVQTGRGPRSTAHPLTHDLFGDPVTQPARQGDLLEGGGPQGMTEAVANARATVSQLEGKVARGAASSQEELRLEEARSLIRRAEGQGLDTGEVQARARAREGVQPEPDDTRDMFAPLAPAAQAGERLPSAGRFYDRPEAIDAELVSPVEIIDGLGEAISDAMAGLGLKVGVGEIPRGGIFARALGVFKPGEQVIRQIDISDVPVFGHEAGHAMHKLFFDNTPRKGQLRNSDFDGLPGAIRGELEDLGAGISDETLREGWAELWRRYLDNPEVLETEAPNALRFIEDRFEQFPAVREAWNLARSDWQTFRESSAQARVGSRISVGDREASTLSIADRWARARTAVIDDMEPVRRIVDAIREEVGIEGLADEADSLARLTRGSVGVANHFLEFGVLDFNTLRKTGPALREVLEPVTADIDDFRRYMVSRRAQELHERDILTGLRDEDVNATVEQLEAKHGDTFTRAFDQLQDWNEGLLSYLRDSGVISRESFDAIRELNQSYVPFYRVVDEGGRAGAGLGANFGHLFSPVKRIKGSGRDIIDPLESLVKNAMTYTHIAQKQQVSRALANLAEKPGVGAVLEQLGTPIRRTQFRFGEIEGKLEDIVPGVDELLEDLRARRQEEFDRLTEGMSDQEIRQSGLSVDDPAEEVLAVFRPGDRLGQANTISVLVDGKRQWYEVDDELFAALEGLNRERLDSFSRWMGAPARTLRAGATLAPEFLIRNPLRDQVMAFVQSEYGYVPFVDMAKGAFELIRKGEAYQQWISSGGYRAALTSLDRSSMQEGLQAMIDGGGVRNVIKHPMDALRALSALMEDATRMGEFMNARAVEGTTKEGLQRSALAAREISVDFARHGAKTAALRHISAFWNARIQGYDRLARAAKENPARFAAKAFGIITMPSLLEYYSNMDDPDYWEQPQWKRDLFWMVKVGDDFVSIPKPFELGLIFGTLPVRVLDSAIGGPGGGHEIRDFLEETLVRGELSGFMPQPTALMPLLENTVNYSFFLRRPIVPRSEQEVRPEFQAGPFTSETAQLLGRWAPGGGVSPRKIDNLLFAWTGGLGRLGTEVADVPLRIGQPERPARRFVDIPGIRGVTDPAPGFSSESVERFYQLYAEARMAQTTLNFLDRNQESEAYQRELENEEFAELRSRLPALRETASELAELRSTVDAIRRDPDMSAEQKQEEIEELGLQARQMAQSALGRELPGGG